MKRYGRGGTEVSVKITCDGERRWFEKRALISGQKEKKRRGEKERRSREGEGGEK